MRVLILGGGGTLGAFSAGALRALHASGWRADAVIGSSAGSINLLRTLQGGPDAAVAFWAGLHWRELALGALSHNIVTDGILDPESFHRRVSAGVDFDAMLGDPRPVSFIVVDLVSGKVAVRGNRTESTASDLRAVARGSYSLPPLLKPVPLGNALLADGGLLRNAPLEHAMQLRATEIIYLCNVQVAPAAGFEQRSSSRALARYLDIYFRRASNVGFADAAIVEGRYRGIPFLTIAPPATPTLGSLVRSMLPTPTAMKRLVALGESCANRALSVAHHVGHVRVPSVEHQERLQRTTMPTIVTKHSVD